MATLQRRHAIRYAKVPEYVTSESELSMTSDFVREAYPPKDFYDEWRHLYITGSHCPTASETPKSPTSKHSDGEQERFATPPSFVGDIPDTGNMQPPLFVDIAGILQEILLEQTQDAARELIEYNAVWDALEARLPFLTAGGMNFTTDLPLRTDLRGDRTDRNEVRTDRNDGIDRNEVGTDGTDDGTDRTDRTGRNDQTDRADRTNRTDRIERSDRTDQTDTSEETSAPPWRLALRDLSEFFRARTEVPLQRNSVSFSLESATSSEFLREGRQQNLARWLTGVFETRNTRTRNVAGETVAPQYLNVDERIRSGGLGEIGAIGAIGGAGHTNGLVSRFEEFEPGNARSSRSSAIRNRYSSYFRFRLGRFRRVEGRNSASSSWLQKVRRLFGLAH